MSSPYPRDVEHGTLDEELHDIRQVRLALSRLQSSPNVSVPDCADAFENGLEQQRNAIEQQRVHNVHKQALLDALSDLADDGNSKGYDELASDALDTIGDNSFGEQGLVDAFNDAVDYEYRVDDDDEALRIIEALADDIASGHY